MADVVMYVRESCPYCLRARLLLGSKGLRWDEIDLDQEPRRRLEMIEKSGRHTVPQIFIDGTHVGGSDDLAAAESSGLLDRLLAGSGA